MNNSWTTLDWLMLAIALAFSLSIIILLILIWRKLNAADQPSAFSLAIETIREQTSVIDKTLRDEQRASRSETQIQLSGFDTRLGQFTDRTDRGLQTLRDGLTDDARKSREESTVALARFGADLNARFEKMAELTERRLSEVRQTLEARLKDIQTDNATKLEQMRQTVDEKLQSTLENRLGESFKLVSERLEQVQRGLGEMQSLATGVGDLKRVLNNVKTRGIFGEVQLHAILEQLLLPEQFAANIATRPDSNERVEFAIKLPGQGSGGSSIWLPIDAKFPREDYERLLDAQEQADIAGVNQALTALERWLRDQAKAIASKYLEPPYTTDFAILFLPTESLYAEVLRRPGIIETLQRERVVLAGPTTLAAILNSLRMGFRTLAIEQHSSEVWQLLGAVRTEFGKFGEVLDKVRKQVDTVGKSLNDAGQRSRAIERKLRDVERIDTDQAQKLLGQDNMSADEEDNSA